MPDGRIVWLYGDTLYQSPKNKRDTVTPGLYQAQLGTRMVHSSAIVQDRGCLHVNGGGGEAMDLLPGGIGNGLPRIGWVESATATTVIGWASMADFHNPESAFHYEPGLEIWFREIDLTGTCAWCFKDTGLSAEVPYSVTPAGDLIPALDCLAGCNKESRRPPPPGSPLTVLGPHHFTYARHVHPEILLADGQHLVTTCQNWDDGRLHPLAEYRPIFSEATR